jgi:hypothetical protein
MLEEKNLLKRSLSEITGEKALCDFIKKENYHILYENKNHEDTNKK